METFDKDTTENTATPRGSGGGLQSKGLPESDAGARDTTENTATPKGSGGGLQSKAVLSNSDAPQQLEDEHEPEAFDQTATPDS